jgi:hypothetical protein
MGESRPLSVGRRMRYGLVVLVVSAAFIVAILLPRHCYHSPKINAHPFPVYCTGAGPLLRAGIVLSGLIVGALIVASESLWEWMSARRRQE